MKKIAVIVLTIALFTSCGGSKSPKEIAQEICDCSSKANALPTSDPNRGKEQDACLVKQREGWDKVKNDVEDAKEFNDVLGKCADEQIKKSFGQ